MPYALLADTVVVIHLLFVIFVVFGGLLVLWRRWLAWFHLPAVAWGAVVEFTGWICPLTPLEIRFRHLAGQAGYDTSFVEQYILPLIYPAALTREIQIFLGCGVLLLNGIVYGWMIFRRHSS